MEKGLTQEEVIAALGCSEATLVRDLTKLCERFRGENSSKYQEFVQAQLGVFELMEKSLLDGKIDAPTANAWRQIRDSVSNLLGLNAPTRNIGIITSIISTLAIIYSILRN